LLQLANVLVGRILANISKLNALVVKLQQFPMSYF